MAKGVSFSSLDGKKLRIGIAVSRWNGEITASLLARCREALYSCGVKEQNITVVEVPGAYELTYAAYHIIKHGRVDVVICLGCLIKGETMHFEYIAEAVTQGIARLNVDTGVPVMFGVLTCLNEKQALARAGNNHQNHGYGWGMSAVEMAILKKSGRRPGRRSS